MSETLSKHYADGRLDDAEFRLRLDKAMSAKTRGDLSGLLSDLPPLHTETAPRRHGVVRRAWWGVSVLAMVFVALLVASAIASPHIPWFLVIVVVAIFWHRGSRRPWHGHHHDHGPVTY